MYTVIVVASQIEIFSLLSLSAGAWQMVLLSTIRLDVQNACVPSKMERKFLMVHPISIVHVNIG